MISAKKEQGIDLVRELLRGKVTTVAGPSGVGKSTLINLLMRFFDIKDGNGAIQIDGQDIRNVKQESLRQGISYIPQDPILFHRTIKENILYGKLNATDEEVIEASKKACCYDFIMELLSFGAMIEVMEPQSLRLAMKGWVSDLWELYEND